MDDAEDRRKMAGCVDIILENGKGGCHRERVIRRSNPEKRKYGKEGVWRAEKVREEDKQGTKPRKGLPPRDVWAADPFGFLL